MSSDIVFLIVIWSLLAIWLIGGFIALFVASLKEDRRRKENKNEERVRQINKR